MAKEKKPADKRRAAERRTQNLVDRLSRETADARKRQGGMENSFIKAAIGFLNTEADTGLNFAQIAAHAHDAEHKARNQFQARRAYDTLLKHFGKAGDGSSESLQALQVKMENLRKLLLSLGEKV